MQQAYDRGWHGVLWERLGGVPNHILVSLNKDQIKAGRQEREREDTYWSLKDYN